MKVVKQIIGFLIIVAVIFAGTVLFIAHKYEDQLKTNAIQALNNKLATEIDVSSVEIEAFKKFPYISIELNDVFAKEALIKVHNNDTLFFFKKVYLQFNILDIIKNTYTLKEISLEGGVLNIKTSKKGEKNYNIFKKAENENKSQKIKLEKVHLNNVIVNYSNEQRKDYIFINAIDAYLKGEFEQKTYDLDIYGNVMVKTIVIGKAPYLNNKAALLDLGLKINSEKERYDFGRGNITLAPKLQFNITGYIVNTDKKSTDYNITINGSHLDISRSITLLPQNVSTYFKNYKSDGFIDFKSTIKGIVSGKKSPEIITSFKVVNGKLTDKVHNLSFDKLNFEGSHSNRGEFSVKNLSTSIEEGTLSGNFSIENFKHPKIKLDANLDLAIENFMHLIKVDTLQNITGSIHLHTAISGSIKDLSNITFNDFENLTSSGEAIVENCSFNIKKDNKNYTSVKADLSIKNNDIKINNLEGVVQESDFNFKGTFNNALSFLFLENQKLRVNATHHSNFIDLNNLLETNSNATSKSSLKLPNNIVFNLNTTVDSVVFRSFYASNVKGKITFKDKQIILNPFSMNCVDGEIKGEAMVNAKTTDNISVKTNCELIDISIPKLFDQFENFNQSTLTSAHLKGIGNAKINYSMRMDSIFNIHQKSIISNVNLTINDGELNGFKPLIETADYIKENKLMARIVNPEELSKRLYHIKFKSLKNTIQIKNEMIYLPKMDIKSNAIDLNLAGSHSFENDIDYSMSFYLSDILTTAESERNVKGKTRVFLHMTGTLDNPIIEYDKAAAKEGIKQEVKHEKIEVKTIIKEEFGLFNNDTSIKETYTPPEKLDFSIEWEEEPSTKENKTPEKDNAQKGIKGFFKGEKDKTDAEDFDFDDGDF